MKPLKHAVFTMARFTDKERMSKYLEVAKTTLIPSLQSQTNQNFEWFVMLREEDLSLLTDSLDYPFYGVLNKLDFEEHMKRGGYTIQTRHDIDDWMAPTYIQEIQMIYMEQIKKYEKFLIQAQPVKLMYDTGEEKIMQRYNSRKTSMFLTLCQADVRHIVTEKKHGLMWEVAPTVFNLPEGMVKWVIHGDNISVRGRK